MSAPESPFFEKSDRYLWAFTVDDIVCPPHLHEQAELVCCLEGHLQATVADVTVDMTPGQYALIFPGQIHGYRSTEHSVLLVLIFSPEIAGPHRGLLRKCCLANPFRKVDEFPEDARIALQRLCLPQVLYTLNLCSAWLTVLLVSLLPTLPLVENRENDSMALTRRLLEYIWENFQKPLTLDHLAGELHVNKYYLSHIFSCKLQINFRDYLNRIRLNHAKQMIRTTGLSITEVWVESGFESQSSFNRIFRKQEGMTPREYRDSVDHL